MSLSATAEVGYTPSRPIRPWAPMLVVMSTTMIVTLDTTIVNVTLPAIGDGLGAGAGVEWIVVAYLLAVCVVQPVAGWLSDSLGRKPVYLAALGWFTAASALCGLAPNFGLLVAARVLQGLGGGALIPVGMAIVMDLFPPRQRGRAIAVWGIGAMAAPAIGPTAGGWLIGVASWHWLFIINLPICVATILTGVRLLPSDQGTGRRSFDFGGLVLGGGGLILVVLSVSQGGHWGWTSPAVVATLTAGALLLAVFVRHELRRSDPLLQVRMFAVPAFRDSLFVATALAPSQHGRYVFIPLQLQEARGDTTLRVGLYFMPVAIVTALAMQIGGRAVDSVGPRRPVLIGSIGTAATMLALWRVGLDAPAWCTVVLMCLHGIAWGITMSPNLSAGVGRLPQHLMGQGSAARTVSTQVAGAVSVAGLAAIAYTLMPADATPAEVWNAYGGVFLASGICAAFAVVLSLRLPNAPDRPRGVESDVVVADALMID